MEIVAQNEKFKIIDKQEKEANLPIELRENYKRKDMLAELRNSLRATQVDLNYIVTSDRLLQIIEPEDRTSLFLRPMKATVVKIPTLGHRGPL